MDNTIFLPNRNADTNLDSPAIEVKPALTYFDQITQHLDQWDGKQEAIREAKAQVTKSFMLQDEDHISGETKVYKLSITLLRTFNQEQVDALELRDQEVSNYVS